MGGSSSIAGAIDYWPVLQLHFSMSSAQELTFEFVNWSSSCSRSRSGV